MDSTRTLHHLDFLSSEDPWMDEFYEFKVGTCHGLWRSTSDSYDILAIVNDEPGNGHLEDVFQYFEHSCRRDGKCLKIIEIWNERFKRHLITKRGFVETEQGDAVKTFVSQT